MYSMLWERLCVALSPPHRPQLHHRGEDCFEHSERLESQFRSALCCGRGLRCLWGCFNTYEAFILLSLGQLSVRLASVKMSMYEHVLDLFKTINLTVVVLIISHDLHQQLKLAVVS